jgi:hypothetical protein
MTISKIVTNSLAANLSLSGTTTTNGDLTFTGTGRRIIGDFSNATVANRVAFQTSTANFNTTIPFIPNGTGTTSGVLFYGGSDIANTDLLQVLSSGVINATRNGTGSYQPLTFYTGGSERMRITSAGSVGIGTNNPNIPLDIASDSTSFGLRIRGRALDNTGTLQFTNNGASVETGFIRVDGSGNMYLANLTKERMAIDLNGNINVGAANDAGDTLRFFDIYNGNTGINAGSIIRLITSNVANSTLTTGEIVKYKNGSFFINNNETNSGAFTAFSVGSSERVRIRSNGELLVGTSGTLNSKFGTFQNGIGEWVQAAYHGAASGQLLGHLSQFSGYSPNNTSSIFYYAADLAALRFAVYANGGIVNFQANNANLSDRREKTNFAPAGEYLSKICAIPVQTFNYIDQNMEEDDGLTLGVTAQDVQAVAPELVMESNWAKPGEEPKMRLSIYQTDLQYALMKCIQEQQAIIEQLKSRLDAANL